MKKIITGILFALIIAFFIGGSVYLEKNQNKKLETLDQFPDQNLQNNAEKQTTNVNNNSDYDKGKTIQEDKSGDTPGVTNTLKFSANVDCNNKQYKMAFLLLVKDNQNATADRVAKLSNIKRAFSQSFHTATRNLSIMDTSEAVVIYTGGDKYFFKTAESFNFLNKQKLLEKFYETHDDIYDFITIYTAPPLPQHNNPYQHHDIVVQNIEGIGKSLIDFSKEYGSNGKLKGINFMDNIDNYSADDVSSINGLLHETGHQWCCYVGENFSGENKNKLEIIQQDIHFYSGLQAPNNQSGDVMGAGYYWVSNGDGTFKAEVPQLQFIYHPFQLYFMGLLPKEEYPVKFNVYNAGIGSTFNSQRATLYKTLSVYDIINNNGERRCLKN